MLDTSRCLGKTPKRNDFPMSNASVYLSLAVIRRFEESLIELKAEGAIQGSMHLCIGQEAVPVGACRTLRAEDALTVTYRGHGWAIARGLPLAHLLAEIMGRESPLCSGRAGSAYLSSAEHGFLGENSIVAAGVPIALGAALAARHAGDESVSLVAIGDGAMNQGAAHEALNMAGVMRLPLVMVIENNGYAELTPSDAMVCTPLAERAATYGMPGERVDGNDADAVEAVVGAAVARARMGGGPSIVEAMTHRLAGHYDLDPQLYRPEGELDAARLTEPLARLAERLDADEVATLEAEVQRLLAAAVDEARAFPLPDPATAREHVYA
jgi:TPP-dependent pyruvate/acetoin dehydrogenase alpha subunit